jgi:hypothetical protein
MKSKLIAGVTLDRKTLLQAGGGLVLMVAVIAVVLGPVRGQFRSIEEESIDQERKLDNNLRVLSPMSKDVVVKDYRLYGDALRKKGSTTEERAAMLTEVELLAKQLKIELAATKPREPPRIDPDYEQYTVDLEFEAEMAQLVGFLYAVETSPRMLRVDRLVLDAKGARQPGVLKNTVVVSRVVTL